MNAEYSEVGPVVDSTKDAALHIAPRWDQSNCQKNINITRRTTPTETPGYTMISQKYFHSNAGRNALGLVGGNEVSVVSGNIVDLESDLFGITRNYSRVPAKKFQSSCPLGGEDCSAWPETITFRDREKGEVHKISTAPRHLPTIQMFSYPGVPAPKPLQQEVYGSPWRF